MARGNGTALGPSQLIKSLFGVKTAQPSTLQNLLVGSILSQAHGGNAGAISANSLLPNNGSSNRVGFGLSDFGKTYQPPAAPSVVGAAKHASGNALRQAAINAITSQYGPVLGALNNEQGALQSQAAKDRADTQNRGNRAEGDVATLYGRLRQYAANTQRVQDQDYGQGIKQTKKNFNQLAGQISKDLRSSGGGIAADLQRMGIDPSVALAGASQDAAFSRSMAREDRTNQVTNQRSSRREYDAGMGRMKNDIIATGNAAVGTQRSQTNAALQDISRQLSTNLMQLQMQRATTLGQRAAALAQYKLSQLQSKAAANDPAKQLDLLMKQAQLAKTIKQTKLLGQPGGGKSTPQSGVDSALAYLAKLYPTNTQANWSQTKNQQLSSILEDLAQQGSTTMPGKDSAGNQIPTWNKNTYGDDVNYLWKLLAGVKGPKGNPMYGQADKNAIRQAVMIALGQAKY